MTEQRKLKRRHLILYLDVIDNKTAQPLGVLADITEKGIMLVSEHPIPVGRRFELKLRLPEKQMDIDEILFWVKSKWCRQSLNDRLYDVGFEIIDLPEDGSLQIEDLIRTLGFKD